MNKKNIVLGVLLIIIGIIVGLNSLGIANIDLFFEGWWTLFIIIPCFIGLFNSKDKSGNFIGLLIGIVLLLGVRDIISFSIIAKLIVPVILVILGLSLMFKDNINKAAVKRINELNKENKNNDYCSTFSSQKISLSESDFKGLNCDAIFGALELDLSNCKIKKDVVINANAVFGGIDIIVPKDIKVITKSSSIFGGIDNKSTYVDNKGPIIYINASCVFGGIEIK